MAHIRHRQEITCLTRFDDLPDWLTMQQVAAYQQKSYWTVQQAVQRGEYPYTQSGKLKLIPKWAVDPKSAVPQQQQQAPPQPPTQKRPAPFTASRRRLVRELVQEVLREAQRNGPTQAVLP